VELEAAGAAGAAGLASPLLDELLVELLVELDSLPLDDDSLFATPPEDE